MKYIIYSILQLICMVLCYLTNWLAVFFSDEEGELSGILNLWQTWDDTLDNPSFIDNSLPKFLNYDWHSHYEQYYIIDKYNRKVYKERLVKGFTVKDRLKRYVCRVLWLYRNCGYGFAYYIFGRNIIQPVHVSYDDKRYYAVDSKGVRVFKNDSHIVGNWYWKVYLGWKIDIHSSVNHRAMIATRVFVQRKKIK